MGILLSDYKGGDQVPAIRSWARAQCTIWDVETIHKKEVFKYLYWFKVNASSHPSYLIPAIPIFTRFTDQPNEDRINAPYKAAVYSDQSFPCHVPFDPFPMRRLSDDPGLDLGRKNAAWHRVAILGSSADLAAYRDGFLLWVLLPTFAIASGLACFAGAIVWMVRVDRREKRKKVEGENLMKGVLTAYAGPTSQARGFW